MTKITGNTKLLGVMGCPIEHSLSPAMHNAALEARAQSLTHDYLEYVYVPLRIEPTDLKAAMAGMFAMGWQGFNITIPHKQAIMPYLQEISPLAQAVGAVNTVWRKDRGWAGTNTDVQGFLAPLQTMDRSWQDVSICILGSGGAARAIVAACHQLGCASIHVVGRNRSKLEVLQHDLSQSRLQTENLQAVIEIHEESALDALLPQMGLVVNTTPVGMHPQVNESPLDEKAIALLPATAIVYDLIYTPRPTLLLDLAQQQGYTTFDGLEMLIQQGAAAFEIWLGEMPSIPAMREAVLEYIDDKAKRLSPK